MTEANPLNIPPGKMLHGRYRVGRALGTGSMGIVYRCEDLRRDGRLVAMKVLFDDLAKDSIGVQRFQNEILAAYKVVHRNVVQPLDYFKEDGLVAYIMEYIEGRDLSGLFADGVLVEIPKAVNWLMEMSRGVQAIHDKGIVHRDLKPENVMIAENGEVKIMDFGIARSIDGKKLTAHGALLGTIEYMSPEYLSEDTVHALGDIYSLGVIGYELITSQLPHRGGGVLEVIQSKLRKEPIPPHEVRADCPIVLSKMILRAMHANPTLRYQNARLFLQDLASLGYETQYRVPTAELERERIEDLAADAHRAYELPPTPDVRIELREPASGPWELIDEASTTPLEFQAVEPQESIRSERRPAPPRRAAVGRARRRTSYRFLVAILLGVLAAVGLIRSPELRATISAMLASTGEHVPLDSDPALIAAAKSCDFERVESEFSTSNLVDVVDSEGESALSWAVRNNCLPVVDFLLEKGASLTRTGAQQKTPIDWARERKLVDVEKLLQYHAAKRQGGS